MQVLYRCRLHRRGVPAVEPPAGLHLPRAAQPGAHRQLPGLLSGELHGMLSELTILSSASTRIDLVE